MTPVVARLREHGLFAALLVAGVVLRVLATVAYRPALFFADSYRYLENTGPLDPTEIWPAGYAVVLRVLLGFGNLHVVPLVQHLLGLAMAVLVYVFLLHHRLPRWVAALATVPILVDAYQVQSEHTVLAETAFQLVVLVGLVLLTWHARPRWWHVALAGLLLGLSAPLRMVGLVLVGPALAVLVLGQPTWRDRVGRAALLAAAFAVPVASYGFWFAASSQEGGFALSPDWLRTQMLYARVARFVDCEQLDVPPEQLPLCPTDRQQATMGTDELSWSRESPLRAWTPPVGVDRYEAGGEFVRRAILGQPLDMARWVAIDTLKAFSPRKETTTFDTPVERWRFQTDVPSWPPGPREAVATYGGGPIVLVTPVASALRTYQLTVGYVPPTLLGLAGILGVAGAISAFRRHDVDGGARALGWSLAGFALVVLPALYQFSWRYQTPTFVLFPVAGALGWQAWQHVRAGHDPRRSAHPGTTATHPEDHHALR